MRVRPLIGDAITITICNTTSSGGIEVSNNVWWEMYLANGSRGGILYKVSPGDAISASVLYSADVYTMQVTDETSGKNFTVTKGCTGVCKRATAEWIVERNGSGKYPLANYSAVTFTGATASAGGEQGDISTYRNTNVTMAVKGTPLSIASALVPGSSGSEFTTTWLAAQ
jgi:hypothetical protein